MKTIKTTNRRKFLAAAGLGGAGVAAAVVTGAVRKPQDEASASAQPAAKSGYHVSEHILKYYKTTEV
ncbi:MAG TPA: twin-arginine translocation signal domain-containing protein [Usitatibacter sp.]|nr:twin-arginine translocation signal domain-containing protein [Usitatibacter sp.]